MARATVDPSPFFHPLRNPAVNNAARIQASIAAAAEQPPSLSSCVSSAKIMALGTASKTQKQPVISVGNLTNCGGGLRLIHIFK
jgi:hypothetical protein